MAKKALLALVSVFIAWSILDFLLHGVLLQPIYAATSSLWRPMDQMNMPLLYLVTLVFSACFVAIYALLVGQKSLLTGVKFGLLFGLATGISMGFGSYAFMPIPLSLAWGWFLGSWIEAIAAGAIAGAIVRS
ncbi:MAG: hypothetical protein HYU75_19565 [Betaproteobacteria bacterium]|nr:hypothetical protein [Betaproteobacteria bacterium]